LGGTLKVQAKTILVVDDEDGVRESLREVLSDEGYRVLDTADGTRALELIRQEKPSLVLLDIWMPHIDGIGLLKEIKSQEPQTNVVMVSGQGLHSGIKTGLILHPLPPNSGILFTGISGDVTIPAHLDYVGSTGYATSLRTRGFAVGTVEHFLAVLHSYGITNLLVKIQGQIPILDGSAGAFCHLIDEAGVHEEEQELAEIVEDRPYGVGMEGGEFISIELAVRFV